MSSLLSPDAGSFRDPSNKVYLLTNGTNRLNNRVLRGVSDSVLESQRKFLASPLYTAFSSERCVVETTILHPTDPDAAAIVAEGWAGVLEHQQVPCITYPYEWTWTMLQDAALLQLRILELSLEAGWTLKDATPYNVQWCAGRPIFIDTPSFEPWNGEDPWVGYRQFCAMFLIPLMIRAHLRIDHLPLLRSCIDGINPSEAARYFSGFNRLKKGVLSHVTLPAIVENSIRKHERDNATATKRKQTKQSPAMILGLVQSLSRLVRKLKSDVAHTDWSHYDRTHTYNDIDYETKKTFVQKHARSKSRIQILDIGCNTGTFSWLCKEFGSHIVAIDGDHDAVEQLYHRVKSFDDCNIQPLVMNFANMSPGQGWAGEERQAFGRRIKPDLVLCLALIHHIRLSSNIPNILFLKWLRALNTEVIIEFVNRNDEMVEKLLTNKREQYQDYNLEQFENEVNMFFDVIEQTPVKSGKRELFFLKPK